MKQVAVYQCKVPPHKIIQQLYLLYRFYNDALLAVETEDGIAYDIVRQLFDMGATNQYYFKRIDQDVAEPTKWLGWETNPRTRGPLQETLVKLISHCEADGSPSPEIIVRDLETYRQLSNLERDPQGTIAGSGKTHDDHAIALMIACYVNLDPWHAYSLPSKSEKRQEMNAIMARYGFGEKENDGPYREEGIGYDREEQTIG